MTDWLEQYSAALDVRDAREQAHKHYIDAYTKLADRTSSTPAAAAVDNKLSTSTTPTKPSTKQQQPQPQPQPHSPSPDIEALRADLSATQKARSTLQTQLTDLTQQLSTLQTHSTASANQITALSKQKTDLERKLKDRDEEIRTRKKLVEDAQDEMVALQLQLNMAEQKSEKLERENEELVDRWMKRMGEEAERVNRDSRW